MANTTIRKPTATLPKEIFDVDVTNHELLKLSYEAYLANRRSVSATTKTRGEVRGGGKKPWRQKGTGRARVGSSRNPLWRTGGVVFGPRGIENYTKTVNKRAKRTALRQALTLANKAGKVNVVTVNIKNGKTAEMVALLKQNNLQDTRRVLLVVEEKTPVLSRAAANMQSVYLTHALYLSVYHILNADKIIMTPAALEQVKTWLASSTESSRSEEK